MKPCTKCKIVKDDDKYSSTELAKNFSKCKDCVSLYNKQYLKKNRIKKLIVDKLYRENNREEINSKRRVENLTTQQIESQRLKNKEYREANKIIISSRRNKRKKERFLTDFSYRIREIFGSHFRSSLKLQKIDKKSSCFDILNYSFDELKEHLESKFEPWMNWNNHGQYNRKTWDDNDPTTWTWQIDHIIPKASFVFSVDNYDEIRKCWSLDNLRPYSAKQNNINGGSKIRHKNRK